MHMFVRMGLIACVMAGGVTEPITSVKRLAKMSQDKKDKLLLSYAQREYPKPLLLLSKATFPIFEPQKMHFDDILHLIKHGASVNLDVPYYWNNKVTGQGTFKPLYLFIKANDITATRILLEHGATVDVVIQPRGSQGYGLEFAHTCEMAKLLINHGACIEKALPSLIQVLAEPTYEPELIPLYLSNLKDDATEYAQEIWNSLAQAKRSYQKGWWSETTRQRVFLHTWQEELIGKFHQKKQYLRDAGVVIDPCWDNNDWLAL